MDTLSGAAQIVSRGDALPDFDLHCPLLSLPLAFGTRLETIPSATPYLRASPQAAAKWKARLGPKRRPRIGLVWSGRPTQQKRPQPLDRARLPCCRCSESRRPLSACRRKFVPRTRRVLQGRGDILHFGDELKDFSDTAALISQSRPGDLGGYQRRSPRRRAGKTGLGAVALHSRLALAARSRRQPVVSDRPPVSAG